MSEVQLENAVNQSAPTEVVFHKYDLMKALVKNYPGYEFVLLENSIELSYDDDFLALLSPEQRAHWNCQCCRSFFGRYAALKALVIKRDENGHVAHHTIVPAAWQLHGDLQDELGADVIKHLHDLVAASTTNLVPKTFNYNTRDLKVGYNTDSFGRAQTGQWNHMHFSLNSTDGENKPHAIHPSHFGKTTAQVVKALDDARALMADIFSYGGPAALTEKIVAARSFLEAACRGSDLVMRSTTKLDTLKYLVGLFAENKFDVALLLTTTDELWLLGHFRSQVIGNYLLGYLEGGNLEILAKNFISQTDPLYYQRAQKEASDNDLKLLKKVLGSKKYGSAFDWRLMRESDLKVVHRFRGTETPQEPTTATSLVDSLLSNREATKETKPKSPTVKTMTLSAFMDTFINKVLNLGTLHIPRGVRPHFLAKLDLAEGDDNPLKNNQLLQEGVRYTTIDIIDRSRIYGASSTYDVIGVCEFDGERRLFVRTPMNEYLTDVRLPLFAENYNSDFFPVRRGLETIMANSRIGGELGESVVLLLLFRDAEFLCELEDMFVTVRVITTDE